MLAKPLLSFTRRGLPGLLLLALGLLLGLSLGRHSSWAVEAKPLVYPLALLLAVVGCNLVGSYVHQRSLHTMKKELLASGLLVVSLWLGSVAR
ncbi:hypothetical protein [Hymenobacter bucti]